MTSRATVETAASVTPPRAARSTSSSPPTLRPPHINTGDRDMASAHDQHLQHASHPFPDLSRGTEHHGPSGMTDKPPAKLLGKVAPTRSRTHTPTPWPLPRPPVLGNPSQQQLHQNQHPGSAFAAHLDQQYQRMPQSPGMPHTPGSTLAGCRAASMGNLPASADFGDAQGHPFASPRTSDSPAARASYPQARTSSPGSLQARDTHTTNTNNLNTTTNTNNDHNNLTTTANHTGIRSQGSQQALPPITSFRTLASPRSVAQRSSSGGALSGRFAEAVAHHPPQHPSVSPHSLSPTSAAAAAAAAAKRMGPYPLDLTPVNLTAALEAAGGSQSSMMTWESEAAVVMDAAVAPLQSIANVFDDDDYEAVAAGGGAGGGGGDAGVARGRGGGGAAKASKKAPGKAPMKATSQYKGVTKHCWTGKWEAHLWDSSAARKKAALAFWGDGAVTNFNAAEYAGALVTMKDLSKEEIVATLRRGSISGNGARASVTVRRTTATGLPASPSHTIESPPSQTQECFAPSTSFPAYINFTAEMQLAQSSCLESVVVTREGQLGGMGHVFGSTVLMEPESMTHRDVSSGGGSEHTGLGDQGSEMMLGLGEDGELSQAELWLQQGSQLQPVLRCAELFSPSQRAPEVQQQHHQQQGRFQIDSHHDSDYMLQHRGVCASPSAPFDHRHHQDGTGLEYPQPVSNFYGRSSGSLKQEGSMGPVLFQVGAHLGGGKAGRSTQRLIVKVKEREEGESSPVRIAMQQRKRRSSGGGRVTQHSRHRGARSDETSEDEETNEDEEAEDEEADGGDDGDVEWRGDSVLAGAGGQGDRRGEGVVVECGGVQMTRGISSLHQWQMQRKGRVSFTGVPAQQQQQQQQQSHGMMMGSSNGGFVTQEEMHCRQQM
ncbi:MAG: hypothetical protein WDW38_010943 [Sanguina aurantia]